MRLADLRTNNVKAIRSAGPRYAPGLDSTAPNLAIASLNTVFETIGLTERFRIGVKALQTEFETAWKDAPPVVVRSFRRRVHNPTVITALLAELQHASPQGAVNVLHRTETTVKRVNAVVQRILELTLSALQAAPPHSDERRERDSEYGRIARFASSVGEVVRFVRSSSTPLITKNALLLLGGWGMGKTHSLCDLTERRMKKGLPTLFYLAQQLPDRLNPIEGLCLVSGLATDAAHLLATLDRMGRRLKTRALLIIDAINEGDRRAWKRTLPALCRELLEHPNVGLILSCRQPFEKQIVGKRTARQFVLIHHQGFDEIEVDAQLSFFQHYNIPAPQVPLITPEFSRPLFLQLLCKAIAHLSNARKHKRIQSFASGQEGMTYLLEYFSRQIGRNIERDLRLPVKTCWRILKGDSVAAGGELVGVAPLMARELRDYITWDECLDAIERFMPGPRRRLVARRLVKRMLSDGLLAEDLRWVEDGYQEIIQFPYQRFGDHVIARCLLRLLHTKSVSTIRRSFYKTTPLGRVFDVMMPSGHSFQKPGLASAIMLEFPERVKGHVPADEIELIFYLPKNRRLIAPFKEAFLEGLPWRKAEHFTNVTNQLIGSLLKHADYTRNDTLEVLVGLATRPGHPCSADKLYRVLNRLAMADRDLLWTEYLRKAENFSVVFRLLEWVERNADKGLSPDSVGITIKLLSLMLTSVRRPFRDRTTRALFLIGLKHPAALFENTLSFLTFNDAYVPERLLAASYGVVMSLWADPVGVPMRTALTPFVQGLISNMFLPEAPCATRHVLLRDYALNLIALARRLDPAAVPRRQLRFLHPPFKHLPVQVPAEPLTKRQREDTEPALHLDFDNYTLGHLIPNRRNYDSENPDYQGARNQLLGRMSQLGYSYPRFKQLDDFIGRGSWTRSHDPDKTERYGKKYSWIAYFELYGLREDNGQLRTQHRPFERMSDCDIDPSFPEEAASWKPFLPDVFSRSPRGAIEWLRAGPVPHYDHLLRQSHVDGLRGPWVLLNGFIEQVAPDDDPRTVFTFLRGLLVPQNRIERLRQELERTRYPGNDAIPRPSEDYYTFAGEIPWSANFASGLRTREGKARRNLQPAFERWDQGPVRFLVEVPVHDFNWESYHSAMNQTRGFETPAPALSEVLGLVNRPRRSDLFDASGRQATVYRKIRNARSGNVLYMRKRVLQRYLQETHQKLAWVTWGERNFSTSSGFHDRADLKALWSEDHHIHKRLVVLT